tara:strand:- start:60419 stop:61135 length:717 start_codon:yes stop_codon:yes gene_type:complete
MAKPKYQRVLLKLSGEALIGEGQFGIDPKVVDRFAEDIKELVDIGVQVGVVIGGGNLFRGKALSEAGLDRITGDQMGMLATMMNALAISDALSRAEVSARLMSAIAMTGVIDAYDRRKAVNKLSKGCVMVFAGGTGNPLVTTDSTASLRAIEINADLLIKATSVDGVYSADPRNNPDAEFYKTLTYQEAIKKELGVMDLTSFCQCRDHDVTLCVANIANKGVLKRIVCGEREGTLVTN